MRRVSDWQDFLAKSPKNDLGLNVRTDVKSKL